MCENQPCWHMLTVLELGCGKAAIKELSYSILGSRGSSGKHTVGNMDSRLIETMVSTWLPAETEPFKAIITLPFMQPKEFISCIGLTFYYNYQWFLFLFIFRQGLL